MSVDRVALRIFGFPVYWYGALIALAVLLGVACAAVREKKLALPRDTTLDFLILALPLALIGARIYYVAFSWDSYASDPLSVFNLREGGLAIYGAVIGGVLAALLFSARRRIPFGTLADLCAPSLALGQAIGRWGNFFNQEAYGTVVSNPAMQFFPVAVYIEADGLWHAATFFYESAWCLIVFAALLALERLKALKKPGELFGAYLFLYAAERIVVEGLRTDSLMLGHIRVSQLLSGLLMLGVLVWVLARYRAGKRQIAVFLLAPAALCALFLCVHFGFFAGQIISAAAVVAAGVFLYKVSVSPA